MKLVRKKLPPKTVNNKPKKVSEIDKFVDAIDAQIALAAGEELAGAVKSWVVDGKEYGEKFVLIPKIKGDALLWADSVVPLESNSKKDVVAALEELSEEVRPKDQKLSGKLNTRIYSVLRELKKVSSFDNADKMYHLLSFLYGQFIDDPFTLGGNEYSIIHHCNVLDMYVLCSDTESLFQCDGKSIEPLHAANMDAVEKIDYEIRAAIKKERDLYKPFREFDIMKI